MTYNDEKFPIIKQTAFKMQTEMEDLLRITEDQIKKTMAHLIRSTFGKYI
jgi:predicted DNA-binding protein